MCACDRGLEKVAIMMIDQFGGKCLPGQVDINRNTALICAHYEDLEKVINQITNIMQTNVRPDRCKVNKNGYVALT